MKRVHLNRELALEELQRVPDGAGGFVATWTGLGMLWGEIRSRTGRETDVPGGAVSVTAFRITVRAVPEGQSARPKPGQRFRMGGRVFDIEAVTELEPRGLYLTCQCEEEVAP